MPSWRTLVIVFVVAVVAAPLFEARHRRFSDAWLRDDLANDDSAALVDSHSASAMMFSAMACGAVAMTACGVAVVKALLVGRSPAEPRGFEVIR